MKKYLYCEVVGDDGHGSFGGNITINFGGADDCPESKRLENTSLISMVDAANYLSGYGWHLIDTCATAKLHTETKFHWIFRKEVSDEEFEQATYYF